MERLPIVWNPIVLHRQVEIMWHRYWTAIKTAEVLYYGYGGAGDITGSYLSGKTKEEKYVYTHIAASYAYAGEAGFTGCKYEDLVKAGVIAYIDHLFAMEEPPKGEISLSKTSVKAVRDGNVQKTPDITLSGDHRNYISVNVPKTSPFITRQRELLQRMVR